MSDHAIPDDTWQYQAMRYADMPDMSCGTCSFFKAEFLFAISKVFRQGISLKNFPQCHASKPYPLAFRHLPAKAAKTALTLQLSLQLALKITAKPTLKNGSIPYHF